MTPIKAVTGASSHLTHLDQKQGPIAIMLNLMDPPFPVGRLFNECRQLRFDEMNARHGSHLIGESREVESFAPSGPARHISNRQAVGSAGPNQSVRARPADSETRALN